MKKRVNRIIIIWREDVERSRVSESEDDIEEERVWGDDDDDWVSSKIEMKCNGMGLGYDNEDDED